MVFKDMVDADRCKVFLNIEEFGVEATVEGKVIPDTGKAEYNVEVTL